MALTKDILKAPEWMNDAACAGAELDKFFPAKGAGNRQARAICADCPVINDCLDYAIVYRMTGIWGGTTQSQRNRLYSREIQEIVRDDYLGDHAA